MLPLVDLDLRTLEEKTCDGPISCAWPPRAAPTPAAAGTRHAAAEPTMGYSASNAVRGEAHRPGQAAALLAPSSARSSTADRRSGARGGSAPPRRPASAGAPPSHPPARTSAVSNRIRAGSACEPPPLLLLLLLAAQNAPCSAAGAGPICAVLCVCGRAGVIYRGSAERSGRRLASGSEKVHRSNLLDPMPTLVLSCRSRVH
jgi:hypothetical protein